MLSSLDVEYAGVFVKVHASVVRDEDEVLGNVARRTVLGSARLRNIDKALLVKCEADKANVRSGGPAEASGEATADRDGPFVDYIYLIFFWLLVCFGFVLIPSQALQ